MCVRSLKLSSDYVYIYNSLRAHIIAYIDYMEAVMVGYKVGNVAAPNKKDLSANAGSRSLKIPWLKSCEIGVLLPIVNALLFIEYYCCTHVEAIDTGHASPSGMAINLALGRLNLWTPRGGLIKVCYRHRLNNRKRPNKASCTVAHLDCNWVGIRWDEVDREALSVSEAANDRSVCVWWWNVSGRK